MSKPNKIERIKLSLSPVEFEKELAYLDYTNVSEEDRFYLKSYGIYNIKLRPDRYMIRIRIDGGNIDTKSLEYIANSAIRYNLDTILTARGEIELHNIKPDMVYEIYQKLKTANIETKQTLTDNFRAITTDPYADFSIDTLIEVEPIIKQIKTLFLGNGEWMGMLPRKFNTAIVGRVEPVVNHWGNDLVMMLSQKDNIYGFNIYAGGKNSEVAQDLNIFVEPKYAFDIFKAVADIYNTMGYRGSRSKTRLFYMIEDMGIDRFRDLIKAKVPNLQNKATLLVKSANPTPATPLKGGGMGVTIYTNYGLIEPKELYRYSQLAQEYSAVIRMGCDQNLHILLPKKYKNKITPDSTKRAFVVACAGSKYCPLSLWDIKSDLPKLPQKLIDIGTKIGFSGCLKGCGRHYHSDIGFIGLRTNLYADTEKAFRIYIGAIQTPVAKPARLLYYAVPKRSILGWLNSVAEDLISGGFENFEDYSKHIRNFKDEFMTLWYLIRGCYGYNKDLFELFLSKAKEESIINRAKELYSDFPEGDINNIARVLSHRLWDL